MSINKSNVGTESQSRAEELRARFTNEEAHAAQKAGIDTNRPDEADAYIIELEKVTGGRGSIGGYIVGGVAMSVLISSAAAAAKVVIANAAIASGVAAVETATVIAAGAATTGIIGATAALIGVSTPVVAIAGSIALAGLASYGVYKYFKKDEKEQAPNVLQTKEEGGFWAGLWRGAKIGAWVTGCWSMASMAFSTVSVYLAAGVITAIAATAANVVIAGATCYLGYRALIALSKVGTEEAVSRLKEKLFNTQEAGESYVEPAVVVHG